MRILKTIGIILASIIALLLIVAAIAPKDFNVERSTTISASPEAIFPYVKYFEKRNSWYPWGKDDPTNKTTVEGTDGEVGAVSNWEGETTGKGSQTFTGMEENKKVTTKLSFIEPYESEAETYLTLDGEDNATQVVWGMSSSMPYPMNLMLLTGMTAQLEKNYDDGLAALKEIVEREAAEAKVAPTYEIKEMELPERYFLAVREEIGMDKVPEHYAIHFPAVTEACGKHSIEITGMPCGMFYTWDMEKNTTDVAHGIPIAQKANIEGFTCVNLGACKALVVDYYGPYEGSIAAHEAIDAYCKANGIEPKMPVIEQYMNDPTEEPDQSKWHTRIYYQI